MFEVLNLEPTDLFHDVFPGSGAVIIAWDVLKLKSEHFHTACFRGLTFELTGPLRWAGIWARLL